jgi:hypothetical protein
MNINKKSWHFRFLKFVNSEVARDLNRGLIVSFCEYIKSLIATIAISGLGLFIIGCVLWILILSPLMYIFGLGETEVAGAGFLFWVISLWVLFVFGLGFVIHLALELKMEVVNYDMDERTLLREVVPEYLQKWVSVGWLYRWFKGSGKVEVKRESLMHTWVYSIKNKVCPMIKLEKGDE